MPLPVFLDTASKRGMTGKSPRTTMRGPARGRKGQVPLPVFPGYRVEARYDVVVTLHPMRSPARGRKGQVPQTVFLDTASKRGMTGKSPRTTMRGPAMYLLRVLALRIFPGVRLRCGMAGRVSLDSLTDIDGDRERETINER